MRKQSGLTKIELICVLVCIFVTVTIFHAAANMSREHAKRQVCANNIRINAMSIIEYAQEHNNLTPYNYSRRWLHDLYFIQKDYLIDYGANPYTFFCPSDPGYNTYKSPDSVHWTKYAPSLIVSGYFWMMSSKTTPPYGSGEKQWITTINVASPATAELVTDAQFSDGLEVDSNYAYVQGGSNYLDYTNHREGVKGCAGGNIGFIDTHVQWRPFSEMEYRWRASGGAPDPYQWW